MAQAARPRAKIPAPRRFFLITLAGLLTCFARGLCAPLPQARPVALALRLALLPKLSELPGPAASLSLGALETGPSADGQAALGRGAEEEEGEE